MIRISLDRDACVGSGFCSRIAPELFRLDEAELVSIQLQEVPAPELEDVAREAANVCPAAAIEVLDE